MRWKTMSNDTSPPTETNTTESSTHSAWKHAVAVGEKLADMLVDVAAIIAIGYIAVMGVPNGVSTGAAQILGGMITTIAIGKRYFQSSQSNVSTPTE